VEVRILHGTARRPGSKVQTTRHGNIFINACWGGISPGANSAPHEEVEITISIHIKQSTTKTVARRLSERKTAVMGSSVGGKAAFKQNPVLSLRAANTTTINAAFLGFTITMNQAVTLKAQAVT